MAGLAIFFLSHTYSKPRRFVLDAWQEYNYSTVLQCIVQSQQTTIDLCVNKMYIIFFTLGVVKMQWQPQVSCFGYGNRRGGCLDFVVFFCLLFFSSQELRQAFSEKESPWMCSDKFLFNFTLGDTQSEDRHNQGSRRAGKVHRWLHMKFSSLCFYRILRSLLSPHSWVR
jgi:hypothetical protein